MLAWVLFINVCFAVFVIVWMDTSNGSNMAKLLWKVWPIALLVVNVVMWCQSMGFIAISAQ